MTEFNLSQKVLEKIKKEHIKPQPRWRFIAKNMVIWFISAVALVFGGLATSVVIYMLVNNDWDVYEHITGSLPEFVFATIPYYWLVFMVVFIVVAHYYLKHTKKGYRYRLHTIAVALFISSTALGILFYNIGMGRAIDDVFAENVPFYMNLLEHRKGIWVMPEEGRLGGEIVMVINENEFKLREFNQREWRIIIRETIIPANSIIKKGNTVKIMGNKLDEETFEAFIIRPAEIPFGGIFDNRRDIKRRLMEHPEIRDRMMNKPPRGLMRDMMMEIE